jgi:hypothetical protein
MLPGWRPPRPPRPPRATPSAATRSMGPRCTSSRRPASTCGSPPPPRGRCADRPRESRCSASPTPATWRAASARAIPIAPAPGPSPPPPPPLRGLHDAGTLEVAYGGGEPFAFRGFAELVAELDTTTTLAQHVTTNGTLLRAATWPAFAGRLGVVRLSIYDDVPWRPAAELLSSHGQRWGANLLVDAAVLPRLPRAWPSWPAPAAPTCRSCPMSAPRRADTSTRSGAPPWPRSSPTARCRAGCRCASAIRSQCRACRPAAPATAAPAVTSSRSPPTDGSRAARFTIAAGPAPPPTRSWPRGAVTQRS